VIVNGQKITQRLVFWKLLGTGEDPGDMHRRVLGRCNKHKEKGVALGSTYRIPSGGTRGFVRGKERGPTGLHALRKDLSNRGYQPKDAS
jgi:hypothetical protein